MERIVTPEILDSLDSSDPAAVRSRRDLRGINGMMGNLRWLRRSLRAAGVAKGSRVVEVGSGDGVLASALVDDGMKVTAIDLMPRPIDLSAAVEWVQGDIFEVLPKVRGDVLVANLFWHHFEDGQLAALAPLVQSYPLLLASEPHRAHFPKFLGGLLLPVINHVTRHDLFASIRAGFRLNELPGLWRLDRHAWRVEEHATLLGACRLSARKIHDSPAI